MFPMLSLDEAATRTLFILFLPTDSYDTKCEVFELKEKDFTIDYGFTDFV